MAALKNQLSSPFAGSHFRSRANFRSDELIDTLELGLRRVLERPTGVSLPLVWPIGRALVALPRIRTARDFIIISDWICRDFHLGPDQLQSRSREQQIAFTPAGHLPLLQDHWGAVRVDWAHFSRHHATAIHAYRVIEQGAQQDAPFRLFIQELEAQITQAIPITAA